MVRQLPMLQLPGLDFVEQTCWHEFLDSSIRLLADLDSRLKEIHGVTLFDVLVLDLLSRGPVRKSELAHALMQPHDQMAMQIRSLRARALVGHSPTPYDRHAVLVSITRAGRMRVEAARRTYAEEVRANYLDRMSYQQMIALTDGHRRINMPVNSMISTPRGIE
jgi:DNA-binding MarR family transcriptional regulator